MSPWEIFKYIFAAITAFGLSIVAVLWAGVTVVILVIVTMDRLGEWDSAKIMKKWMKENERK